MKAVAEKEEKARTKEDEDLRRLLQTRSVNKDGLNFQMHEREQQKLMKEFQDKKFAEDVKIKVFTEQQKEDMKVEESKRRMRVYNQALSGQMEEARLKRKYGDSLMTEHERRVHDKDIKAFVEMDNQSIYSRGIPGMKNSHE